MVGKTPDAEIEITPELARGLLRIQCPEISELPIRFLGAGWDNVMYRIGEDWVIRLPRRAHALPYFRNEQYWLERLAPSLSLPVPVAMYKGQPSDDYPWPWSLIRFIPGQIAHEAPLADSEASVMANFLRGLHVPAPIDAPENAFRGVPLSHRAEAVEERIGELRKEPGGVTTRNLQAWKDGLVASEYEKDVWLHGDLHARNILVEDGKLSGVIDWGDITSGDPATDLATAWMLFDQRVAREAMVAAYQADEDLIARAKGWAFSFASVLLYTGRIDDPIHAAMARNIFRRLSEDA